MVARNYIWTYQNEIGGDREQMMTSVRPWEWEWDYERDRDDEGGETMRVREIVTAIKPAWDGSDREIEMAVRVREIEHKQERQ